MRKSVLLFTVFLSLVFLFSACKKNSNSNTTSKGTCSDGILNQDETAIDCGGKCSPCATCSDGIQNQGETAIDCGGPCSKCVTTYPTFGSYGHNLLRKDTITIKAGQNIHYSLAADIAENSSLRVTMKKLSVNGSWGLLSGSQKGWLFNDVTEYYVNFPVKADVMIIFSGTGGVFIEGYENGATNPSWNKTLYW